MPRSTVFYHLDAAAYQATKKNDKRAHQIGAVGVRSDGVTVKSCNGAVPGGGKSPRAHAEIRLAQKLDVGSTVYVARIGHLGEWRLARPCHFCVAVLLSKGVRAVYYTIRGGEFGALKLR